MASGQWSELWKNHWYIYRPIGSKQLGSKFTSSVLVLATDENTKQNIYLKAVKYSKSVKMAVDATVYTISAAILVDWLE